MTSRPERRRVDGVLLLDKPLGLTSNAALQRAKRLYAAHKAGHTGTLDPLASGLLPICFGEATKFAQAMLDARKAYVATIRFGVATSTGDAEGETTATASVDFGRAAIERALAGFVGTIAQVPPRHAALKFQGRAYYHYARNDVDIPRVARHVEIAAIELLDWSAPDAAVRVECGKGTYVRVLAEDIAAALGTVAHLSALRRTAVGPFRLERACAFEQLDALDAVGRDGRLLPADAALADLPRLEVEPHVARALREGRAPRTGSRATGRFRAYANDAFVGVVESDAVALRAVRLARVDE